MELKSRNLSRYGLPYSSSNCTFMELKCLDEYCSDVLLSGSNCTFMELKFALLGVAEVFPSF